MAFKELNETEDEQLRRHVATHFEFEDESPHVIFHITGSVLNWTFEARTNYDPVNSGKMVTTACIGELLGPTNAQELEEKLRDVEVDNSSMDVNCQTWIGEALENLKNCGLLTQEAVEQGIDKMTTLITNSDTDELSRSDSFQK